MYFLKTVQCTFIGSYHATLKKIMPWFILVTYIYYYTKLEGMKLCRVFRFLILSLRTFISQKDLQCGVSNVIWTLALSESNNALDRQGRVQDWREGNIKKLLHQNIVKMIKTLIAIVPTSLSNFKLINYFKILGW